MSVCLTLQVEELHLEVEHNKLEVRKSEAEFQSYFRKSREHYEEKVSKPKLLYSPNSILLSSVDVTSVIN